MSRFHAPTTVCLHPNGTSSLFSMKNGRRLRRYSEEQTKQMFGADFVEAMKRGAKVVSPGKLIVTHVDREKGMITVSAGTKKRRKR